MHVERTTKSEVCKTLARNWKPQILQACAHRRYIEFCDSERAAGRDTPLNQAKARDEAEKRNLQAEADQRAQQRAQEEQERAREAADANAGP